MGQIPGFAPPVDGKTRSRVPAQPLLRAALLLLVSSSLGDSGPGPELAPDGDKC